MDPGKNAQLWILTMCKFMCCDCMILLKLFGKLDGIDLTSKQTQLIFEWVNLILGFVSKFIGI
jgi:hypothetical protein